LFTGRYVRIVNFDGEFLALSEVEIIEEEIIVTTPEIEVQVEQ